MPFPSRMFRANISATINGDSMVNTVWVRGDATYVNGSDTVKAQAIATRVRDAWGKFLLGGNGTVAAANGRFASTTQWGSVTCYAVSELGVATTAAESSFSATHKGTGAVSLPGQVALCATLLTGAPGRSNRGRLFLGGLAGSTLEANGKIRAIDLDVLRNGLAGFYTAVRDNAGTADEFRPVVVSPTLGTSRRITTVQMGDVYDTMRSRRNARSELRSSSLVDANAEP